MGVTTRVVHPWKRLMGTGKGTDRGYTRRVWRAQERGAHTSPGTRPNAMDPGKVARKRRARADAA